MVTFTLSRNGHHAKLRVPATENDIRRAQREFELPYTTDTRVYVDKVDSDISELSRLEGTEQNMDFLNLLGRLMYGMVENEYEQFRYGLWWEEAADLKDIINIAVTPNRYSIIDEKDLHKSGLNHEFDLRGGIPTSEVNSTDFSIIARELIDSGKCEETPFGNKLHVNEEIPVGDFFDGKHMPAYFDRDFVFAVALKNDGDEDFLFLPCTTDEIMRSANRLNSFFPTDLSIRIEDSTFHNEGIADFYSKADIYTLNNFAELISGLNEDETEKLLAVVDYGRSYFKGLNDLRSIVKIGEKLNCFNYVSEVSDDYDLGRYLILRSGDYAFDESLEPYFNFRSFGEDIRGNEAGRFLDDCYVGIKDYDAIKQFMYSDEMSMN